MNVAFAPLPCDCVRVISYMMRVWGAVTDLAFIEEVLHALIV